MCLVWEAGDLSASRQAPCIKVPSQRFAKDLEQHNIISVIAKEDGSTTVAISFAEEEIATSHGSSQ